MIKFFGLMFKSIFDVLFLFLSVPVEPSSEITFGHVLMFIILLGIAFTFIFFNSSGGDDK